MNLKTSLGRALLRLGRMRQIRILGCSRSGTTIFHLAFIAFRNTIIHGCETGAAYPFLRDSLKILWGSRRAERPRHLVTKRNFGWFHDDEIKELTKRACSEDLGIIYLVRDPRDVLTSMHPALNSRQPYVTPNHWLRSIRAGEELIENLASHSRTLVVRYEDFVQNTAEVEAKLENAFQLRRRDGVASMADVKSNVERLGYELGETANLAVPLLRNLHPESIGRWRRIGFDVNSTIIDHEMQSALHKFMERYNYE